MKQLKKVKVLMLPTEKAEDSIVKSAGRLWYFKGYFTQDYLSSQNKKSHHLYLVSDEEIKEGDNIYWKLGGEGFLGKACKEAKYENTLKVIATTNPELTGDI